MRVSKSISLLALIPLSGFLAFVCTEAIVSPSGLSAPQPSSSAQPQTPTASQAESVPSVSPVDPAPVVAPSSGPIPQVNYRIIRCTVDPNHPREEVDMTLQVTDNTPDPVDFTGEPALLISGTYQSFVGVLSLSLSSGQTGSVSTKVVVDSIPSPLVCGVLGATYYDFVTGRNY